MEVVKKDYDSPSCLILEFAARVPNSIRKKIGLDPLSCACCQSNRANFPAPPYTGVDSD